MQITDIAFFLLEVPLGGRIYNPRLLWHRKQSVLVRLSDNEGRSGWGECWCFDSSADALIRFLQTEISPNLKGCHVHDIATLWDEVWAMTSLNGRHGITAAALSGIDIALHDLKAQAEGLPLGALGAADSLRDEVPVYASAGLYHVDDSIERLSTEMSDHIAQGHDRVKMKFGALPFEQDVARMKSVREAIGPNTGLIVDAVYSLDRERARSWLPVWKALGVEAVQAPFPTHDWESMRWLNHACGMPVMVFEAESRFEIFRSLLETKAIGVLQFSPIAVGGITPARRLIALARAHGVPVTLQCSSTWLAESTALELARGHHQVAHVELHTLHQGLFNVVPIAERTPCRGRLVLHNRTGLGIAPPLSDLRAISSSLPDQAAGVTQSNQPVPALGTSRLIP